MLMRSRASWPFEDVTRRGRRRAPRRRGRSRGTRANARAAPRNEGGGEKTFEIFIFPRALGFALEVAELWVGLDR